MRTYDYVYVCQNLFWDNPIFREEYFFIFLLARFHTTNRILHTHIHNKQWQTQWLLITVQSIHNYRCAKEKREKKTSYLLMELCIGCAFANSRRLRLRYIDAALCPISFTIFGCVFACVRYGICMHRPFICISIYFCFFCFSFALNERCTRRKKNRRQTQSERTFL